MEDHKFGCGYRINADLERQLNSIAVTVADFDRKRVFGDNFCSIGEVIQYSPILNIIHGENSGSAARQ